MSERSEQQSERPFADGAMVLMSDAWWTWLPAQLRSAAVRWRATSALLDVFDDAWLRELTFMSHPFGRQVKFRYGRWAILRLGVALSLLGCSSDTKARLRTPGHYEACATELDFGLFLRLATPGVCHEPCVRGRGPDYFATIRSELAFEVKSPHQSESLMSYELLTQRLHSGLDDARSAFAGINGWALELMIEGDVLSRANKDAVTEHQLVESLKAAMLEWSRRPRKGDVPASRDVSLRARRCDGIGVGLSGPSFVGDADYEARRLLHVHVRDASDQLASGGVPGFVVLAREGSGLAGNYMHTLASAVRIERERFASVLGFILYDTEVDAVLRRPVSLAHFFLRSEHRRLTPELRRFRRGGRASLQFF